jgi:hypothetical protein
MNFYNILFDEDLKKLSRKKLITIPQLAYCVNNQTWEIFISRSGHAKLTRGKDRHDYSGGWIFPKDERIIFNSGSLDNIDNKEQIRNAISNALQINLWDKK